MQEIRLKAGLSRKKMGQLLGDVSIHSIICYEWTDPRFGYLLPAKQLSLYFEFALKVGVDPVDVMNAYCEADNERRPWLCEKSPTYAQFVCASTPAPNLFDIAMSDPQFFLERVRWNPLRIQAAMDRLAFWNEYKDFPNVAGHSKGFISNDIQFVVLWVYSSNEHNSNVYDLWCNCSSSKCKTRGEEE